MICNIQRRDACHLKLFSRLIEFLLRLGELHIKRLMIRRVLDKSKRVGIIACEDFEGFDGPHHLRNVWIHDGQIQSCK